MDLSQTYATENAANINIIVCTTGITSLEKACLNLPQNIHINASLTPKTQILVTYKCTFTEKYIQALGWNIPIVSSAYLYNTKSSYLEYQMKPFEGAKFSTSGITNESYSNYFILLGATYEPNCTIFIDFLITNNESSEKYKFCKKYGIPVIFDTEIYTMDHSKLTRRARQDAKEMDPVTLFKGTTFYLDSNLPKALFNRLRRLIIENDGIRVSIITDKTDYILTLDYDKYVEHSDKLYYYQYVFDCAEYKALLYPEFYRYHRSRICSSVLEGQAITIDPGVGDSIRKYTSIIKSLGGLVRSRIDMKTTHLLVSKKNPPKLPDANRHANYNAYQCGTQCRSHFSTQQPKSVHQASKAGVNRLSANRELGNMSQVNRGLGNKSQQYQIVITEWIDQCLMTLQYVNEQKYLLKGGSLKLTKTEVTKREMKFQFTGLPAYFKDMATEKFEKYRIGYSDSPKYEDATHLIMGNMNTTEKLLFGMVNGSWILTPEFVENFENQPVFDFSRYEWRVEEDTSEKDAKIIRSIVKWRKRIQGGGTKPFHNWKVRIACKKEKAEHYKKLIEYGGGSMTTGDDYTHYFKDRGYEVDNRSCIPTDYVFSYLFK